MDFRLVIRHRLRESGTEQRDLARAAHVTESYISIFATRRKRKRGPLSVDVD